SVLLIAGPQGDVAVERGVEDVERFVGSASRRAALDVAYTDWSITEAIARYDAAFRIFRRPNVIVAMSATMAMAVADKTRQLQQSQSPIIGSMIWSEAVGEAIADGSIEAAIAGSQFTGALALSVLFDYLMGEDNVPKGVNLVSPLVVITAQNYQHYAPILRFDALRLDFKRTSRHFYPELSRDELRLADLLPSEGMLQFINSLTEEEQAFLRQHPLIRVGVEPDGAPIDFINLAGQHSGLMASYLSEIEKLIPVRFEVRPSRSWEQTFRDFSLHKVDMLSLISESEERRSLALFTDVIGSFPAVIVAKKDGNIGGIDSLLDKNIAVISHDITEDFLHKKYPELNIVAYNQLDNLLNATLAG
ncbi:MAG: transporter substrate-binding domain-containing protein, partial [Shewanella sp.]